MYEEPKHILHQVDIYFAMVGVGIRITREITSIALLANKNEGVEKIKELTDYYREAEIIFDTIISSISEEDVIKITPDFNPIKKTLNPAVFQTNEELQFVKTELEKIIFELETLYKIS